VRALALSLLVGCAPVVASRPALGAVERPRARPARSLTLPASSPSGEEPSVGEVVHMALEAARGVAPERIAELARRARLTGLVPQLRLSVERGLQQDLSSSTTRTVDKTNTASGDDLSLSAGLTFDLDRLVFAPDEVRLLSVERWLAGDRRKLIQEVVKLYYQRRRLLRERALGSAPDGELDDSIAEVEALLDGVTNSAFSRAYSLQAPVTSSSAR
jgi:hypothetical protein